jgi:hypothetical protein
MVLHSDGYGVTEGIDGALVTGGDARGGTCVCEV